MYIYTYIDIYIYIYIYIYICIYVHIHIHICINIYIHVCAVYVYIYILGVFTHVCIYILTHILNRMWVTAHEKERNLLDLALKVLCEGTPHTYFQVTFTHYIFAAYAYKYIYITFARHTYLYGVATISRLLKIIGLFCKRALLKRPHSAKETCNFTEPTNRSHPIGRIMCIYM